MNRVVNHESVRTITVVIVLLSAVAIFTAKYPQRGQASSVVAAHPSVNLYQCPNIAVTGQRSQSTKFTGTADTVGSAKIGGTVVVMGNQVIVGAPDEDGGKGAVYSYLFNASGAAWLSVRITSPTSTGGGHFGDAIAISDSFVVVGAPSDAETGVSGTGRAHFYQRNSGSANLTYKYTLRGENSSVTFGDSVGSTGSYTFVGDSGFSSGAGKVYRFAASSTAPAPSYTATLSGTSSSDLFGASLAVNDGYLVVGAPGVSSNKGAAYLYASPFSLSLSGTLTTSNTNSLLGTSVAITRGSGGTVVVGAPGTSSNNGEAYVFPATANGSITPSATLTESVSSGLIGLSVAIDENTIVVGSPRLSAPGAAYVYVKSNNSWTPYLQKLQAADDANHNAYGVSVGISGARVVVGAEDNASVGSAYHYELPPEGFVGKSYSYSFSAYGDTSTLSGVTYSVSSGSLPSGLSLSSGGTLSGTPTTVGSSTFTVQATATGSCVGSQEVTLVIHGSGLQFFPLSSPVRLLETRTGYSGCENGVGQLSANSTRTQNARTTCSTVPSNATAVVGNITVIPAAGGYLTLFPSSSSQPSVANSNFNTGEVTNNLFTVGLGSSDGAFKIFTSAATDVVVDLTGYFAPPDTGGFYYHSLPSPVRLLETRSGQSVGCYLPGAQLTSSSDLQLQGSGPLLPSPCSSIPSDAAVLVGNATTVSPSGGGYLTIYPGDVSTAPTTASSNYAGSDVINGPFLVKLGPDGTFKVHTSNTTDLIIDITGYYSANPADVNSQGYLFNSLASPLRLLETRTGTLPGCYRTYAPITGGTTLTQEGWETCTNAIPNTARSLVGNVTVVSPAALGYLTFFPANLTTPPTVATLNYPYPLSAYGHNRHYYVGLYSTDGKFKIYASSTTEVIVDVSGYFAR